MTDTTSPGLAEAMPILARNEGVWEGWYRYYDAATGKLVDQHRSRLFCRLTRDGDAEYYHQTNHYFWEDGRTEVREFPARYENGRIWWDNELIKGWCATMQPDDFNRSSCLNWTRKNEPGIYLYEMIQIDDAARNRARTWQWFRDGVCYQRTLIDERLVSRDWRNWTNNAAPDN
ncbi:DUF3598 domain-containing protein [Parapedomonas caeni]|jgi:hypothetical protein